MDLLTVLLTATLTHRRTSRLRAILGGVFGGGYALAVLLLSPGGIVGLLADLLAGVAICLIAFYGKGTRPGELLRLCAVYLLVSAILGGIMTALFYWLNRLQLPLGTAGEDGISVWLFALLAAVAGIFTCRGGRWLGLSGKTKTVEIELTAFGKTVRLRGFVDTGNLLRDPVSGRNVIVADREKLRGIFPAALLAEATDPRAERWLSDGKNAARVRWIPTETAAGSRLLLAAVPERLEVTDGKRRFPADYLVAAGDVKTDGGFDALVPME